MSVNLSYEDEQRRLQEENFRGFRDLELSKLSEEEEIIAHRELEKFDEVEREIQALNGEDKRNVEAYEWEINDTNKEISTIDKELTDIEKQISQLLIEQKTQANDLKQQTDALAKLTSQIERLQKELQLLRQQQHDLNIEHDKLQSYHKQYIIFQV
ncbi:unnamed protein product [Didymodactylos carnosus]|uniref:Uncharacterized protein n=1 Tax=Didymodactylos carnosus TaxID=1234261 RepID=A0A815U6C7_9BILA|nr:unnamed protein product [Didymodactylos carnosus]CAF4373020.1 unnamed protein product [Didymodactylos carnosus]